MAAQRPIQGKILSNSENDYRSGKEEMNVTERHLEVEETNSSAWMWTTIRGGN